MHHWSKAASQPLDNVTLQLHVRISHAQHISLPRRRRHLLCLRRKCKIVCNRTKHRHWQFSVADWAKESGKLAEGKWKIGRREVANQHMQLDRGKQIWNMIWREIQLKNAEHGSGKLAEGKWKIGRREKSGSTAAPSWLMLRSSLKKLEFTCWRFQLCAPLPTFYVYFCHNRPQNLNSPVFDTSFSQLTTQWVGEPD